MKANKLFTNIGNCLQHKRKHVLFSSDQFSNFMCTRVASMDSPRRAKIANEILGDLNGLTEQQYYDFVRTCIPKISVSDIFKKGKYIKHGK